jgi:alkylation response protein AidB-like acyl-CoA dehydrogenase
MVQGTGAGSARDSRRVRRRPSSSSWQRALELALELQGPYASLWQGSPRAIEDGWWQFRALRSRGDTITGGTSEIMKNILAERVLGLPKD